MAKKKMVIWVCKCGIGFKGHEFSCELTTTDDGNIAHRCPFAEVRSNWKKKEKK